MRILITTIAHFCDLHGGAPRIALDEATELLRRGHEVWLLALGRPGMPEHDLWNGLHLLRYTTGTAGFWNPSRGQTHLKAAAAVLKRHLPQVDAIHGHMPLQYLAALSTYGDVVHASYTIHSPAAMEMAINTRSASPLRRMTGYFAQGMINRLEAECLRRSRVVTALSQYTIDCIGKQHGESIARKVKLIPGWVETSRFVPVNDRSLAKTKLGWPVDLPLLFTLRRMTPRMGLNRLLEACQLLNVDGFRFHLIIGGDGPLRSTLQDQAKALGLGNMVTFQGRIDDEMLPLAYAACDAFVLPTAELECFGIIAIEALSAGRPVLATPIGAIPEIIGQFAPQWLARSSQPADIAALLRRFLKGDLPMPVPARLHDQVDLYYGRDLSLRAYIEATIAGN